MKTVLSDLKEDYQTIIAGNILSSFPALDFTRYKDHQITAKGYANYFGCTIRTAERYLTRDKKQLAIPRGEKLRWSHFLALYGDSFVK